MEGQHQLVAEPIFNGYRARLGRSGASARMKCVPEPGASISFAWSHCGVRARPKRSGTFGWACTVLVQIPGTDHSEFQEAIQQNPFYRIRGKVPKKLDHVPNGAGGAPA